MLIVPDSFLDCLPRVTQVEIEGEQDVDKKWQSFAF
jgi:hypothetical protein